MKKKIESNCNDAIYRLFRLRRAITGRSIGNLIAFRKENGNYWWSKPNYATH